MHQQIVPASKLVEGPPGGKSSTADFDGFENTASTELGQDHLGIEIPRHLGLVWLYTSNVVDVRRVYCVHEADERRLENETKRWLLVR